jgi:hypothetical protein
MQIRQAYVSKTLEAAFGSNFRLKWKLSEYSNPNEPAVFFGLYSDEDRLALKNHKSQSIVIWGGGDMKFESLQEVKKLVLSKKSFTSAYPGEFSNILTANSIPHKALYIPLKDYSDFTVCPLGEKIYVYRGLNGNRSDYFKWNEVIEPIIKYFGKDMILYTEKTSISDLIHSFYRNSFVYIKPTPRGGCTSMFELGHMGRKTIGNGLVGLNNILTYTTPNDIINLIKAESNFIGKIRTDVAASTKKVFIGPEWMDLDFWK